MDCVSRSVFKHKLWCLFLSFTCSTTCLAKSAAQTSRASQDPSIQIQWLTVFDHRSLLTWPPNFDESRLAQTVLEQLQMHVKLARDDVQYLTFQIDLERHRAMKSLVEQGERAYQSLRHREAAAQLSQALEGFYAMGFHLYSPKDVSKVQFLLGKTRLEQG